VDGSFVSATPEGREVKRWNYEGRVIQTFSSSDSIHKLMALNNEIIVGAPSSRFTSFFLWRISTGRCCCTTTNSGLVTSLEKISESKFVSSSTDYVLRVWNEKGECIETINTTFAITEMLKLGELKNRFVSRDSLFFV